MRLLLLLLLPLLGSACRNPCQEVCKQMYDYAAECGYEWTKDDLKACYEAESRENVPKSEREVCREYYDDIRQEWPDCEEIARYFDGSGDDTSQPVETGTQETGTQETGAKGQ